MEPESSHTLRGDKPVTDPAPASDGTEIVSRKRVLGSDVEDDLAGLGQKKVELNEILDNIQETNKKLNERAMEVDVKEKSVKERILELQKKEKRVELLSKLMDERSCELDRKEKEFDEKQRVSIAREKELNEKEELCKGKAAEIETKEKELEEKRKEFEEKEKGLKEKANEVREEIIEAKARELEWKRKFLEVKEKEIQGKWSQGETSKRPRVKLLAEEGTVKRPRHHDSASEEIAEPGGIKEQQQEHVAAEPEQITFVEAEFNDFKKSINSFEIGQLWALYDRRIDNMPRLYGRVKGIVKSRSCIHVKWLTPKGDEGSVPVTVPVACGRYKSDQTITRDKDHLEFSHKMQGVMVHGNNFTAVYPKKGETWALFRDWKKSWNDNTQLHKPPYNYDFVEILLEFDACLDVSVVYLEKVNGFVSVYKHAEQQQGLVSRVVPADEMNRFSHRVPSFKLSGEERQGVPVGSFELDPSAIPRDNNKEVKKETDSHRDGSTKDVSIVLD